MLQADPFCPKCRDASPPTPKYHSGDCHCSSCARNGGKEHLRYECPCGYAWVTPTKDADPNDIVDLARKTLNEG
jgi:hypothetical protein